MPSPTVSVALCACNGAAYVGAQVRSILDQTRPVDEIVLRDDASSDDTVEIVEAIWRAHRTTSHTALPTLRITRNPRRLGVARNFESALADCQGELIALCDQDDLWHPQRIATLVPRFESDAQLLLLHGDARLVDVCGKDLGSSLFQALGASEVELRMIESGQGWKVMLDRNLVTGATTLLRRSLLDIALPIPEHWLHDEWLGTVAALLEGLQVERKVLLDYRQHTSNQIGARRASLAELMVRAISPRGDWHAQKLQRASALAQRAPGLGSQVSPQALAAIEEKVAHHAVRAALPRSRGARVIPVWREWRTGRYRRYGRGLQGVLRDLLQSSS